MQGLNMQGLNMQGLNIQGLNMQGTQHAQRTQHAGHRGLNVQDFLVVGRASPLQLELEIR